MKKWWVVGIFLFLILGVFMLFKSDTPSCFTKEAWEIVSNRTELARDLVAKKSLEGKNRTEVLEMLGTNFMREGKNFMEYDVSKENGMLKFYIVFENDIVARCEVYMI